MNRKARLLKKLHQGSCSREELEALLDLLEEDSAPPSPEVLETLWQQLEASPPLADPFSLALLDRTLSKLEASEAQPPANAARHRLIRWRRWLAVAAGVLLLLGVFSWLQLQMAPPVSYRTAYGEQQQLRLPDGSSVTLNANSSLSYQPTWKKGELRQVWLEGEAYFEVRKGQSGKQKFQVITPDLTVEVLGTIFNVNTRAAQTEVYLQEGKVEVALAERGEAVSLQPGELMTYSRHTGKANKGVVAVEAPADWKDGTLTFRDKPLREVLSKFEEIYGLRAQVTDDTVLERRFTLSVPVDSATLAYELLRELTGLDIVKQGDILLIE